MCPKPPGHLVAFPPMSASLAGRAPGATPWLFPGPSKVSDHQVDFPPGNPDCTSGGTGATFVVYRPCNQATGPGGLPVFESRLHHRRGGHNILGVSWPFNQSTAPCWLSTYEAAVAMAERAQHRCVPAIHRTALVFHLPVHRSHRTTWLAFHLCEPRLHHQWDGRHLGCVRSHRTWWASRL